MITHSALKKKKNVHLSSKASPRGAQSAILVEKYLGQSHLLIPSAPLVILAHNLKRLYACHESISAPGFRWRRSKVTAAKTENWFDCEVNA